MLISLVPLAISLLVSLSASGTRLRQQSYNILSAVSNSVQIQVKDYLGLLETAMETFRSDKFIIDQLIGRLPLEEEGFVWNAAPINYYLTDSWRPLLPANQELSILDAAGVVIASSLPQHLGADMAQTPGFIHGSNGIYFDNITTVAGHTPETEYHRRLDGAATWAVAAPILDPGTGQLLAVLFVAMDPGVLTDLLLNYSAETDVTDVDHLQWDVHSHIIDRDGQVIASTRIDDGEFGLGNALEILPIDPADGTTAWNQPYRNYRNVKVLGHAHTIDRVGWVVVSEIDLRVASRPIRDLRYMALGGFLFVVLAILLIAASLTEKIIRPLYRIMGAHEALGAGNIEQAFLSQDQIPNDEIGALMTSHNKMLASLNKRSGQLQTALDSGQELITLLKRPFGEEELLEPALGSLCALVAARCAVMEVQPSEGEDAHRISFNTMSREMGLFLRNLPGTWAQELSADGILKLADLPPEILRRHNDLGQGPLSSFLSVPVISRQQHYGRIYLLEKEGHQPFDEEDVDHTIRFANSLALVLDNMALLRQLQASEERYRLLYEDSLVIVFQSTYDGQLIECNPRFYQILGYDSFEELAAINLGDLYYLPEDRITLLKNLEAKGKLENYEITLRDKEGNPRYFLNNLRRSGGPQDADRRLDGIMVEITGQKAAEQEKQRLQQQLMARHQSETIGTMAAGVAHEFNNLLMGMMSYAELGKMSPDSTPEHEEYFSNIISQSKRGAKMVSQILAFSRQAVLDMAPTDIGELLEPTINILSGYKTETQYRVEADDSVHQVLADRTQLQVIITNLALNGQEAMLNGGTLTFRLSDAQFDADQIPDDFDAEPGPYVCLEIIDSGTGIPEDLLHRIIDPFYTTKGPGKGIGLGLSQAYGVIRQHRGFLIIDSVLGAGTTVSILLPALSEELARDQAPEKGPASSASSPESHPVDGCILVVEDSEIVRNAARDLLEATGYRVLVASSGEEGLEIFRDNDDSIDLVLSDLIMPGVSGREVCQRIRQMSPDVRLVMFSGYVDAPDIVAMQEQGLIDGFLQKPFNAQEMDELFRSLLKQ